MNKRPDHRKSLAVIAHVIQLAWRDHPAGLLGYMSLSTIQAVLPIPIAWLTKSLYDALARAALTGFDHSAFREMLPILLAQGLLVVLDFVIAAPVKLLKTDLEQRLEIQVSTAVYRKTGNLVGIAYSEDAEFHDSLRLGMEGARSGSSALIGQLVDLTQNTLQFVGFVGILLTIGPLLPTLLILSTIPHLFVQMYINRQQFGLHKRLSTEARRAAYFQSILADPAAAKEIQLFGLVEYFLQRLLQSLRLTHSLERRQIVRETQLNLLLNVASSMVGTGILVVVILHAATGAITIGDVALFFSATANVQRALRAIVYGFAATNQGLLQFSHFDRLMSLPPTVYVSTSPVPVPELHQSIEFQDVSFRYSPQHPWILRHLNLRIPAGQCLALVGLNGEGKTTVIKLLTRLYDPEIGAILWDGIDIREFDPSDLRKRIGTIFQDFVRYALPAFDNIGVGNIDRADDREAVANAAKKAGIHALLSKLPLGYDTPLARWLAESSAGVDLSGGEWQKVALARMFMRDAVFLILDEPTSALDAPTEQAIYACFKQLVGGTTSMVVSHRFSTVRIANLIAVLEDGCVKEYGTHSDLLNLGGTYSRLYAMQARQYA